MAISINIPQWRDGQQPVWISCQNMRELPGLDEHVVEFRANGQTYVAFVPTRFINTSINGLAGQIIADVDEGLLIDIPTETLTSGARIIVTNDEMSQVLIKEEAPV